MRLALASRDRQLRELLTGNVSQEKQGKHTVILQNIRKISYQNRFSNGRRCNDNDNDVPMLLPIFNANQNADI